MSEADDGNNQLVSSTTLHVDVPVAVFFGCIVLMLVGMTVWELKSPTVMRKGFLPIATTRGDRLFIGLLVLAILANVGGLWLQHEVMQSLVHSTLQSSPLPPLAADVFGGFVTAARVMAVLAAASACISCRVTCMVFPRAERVRVACLAAAPHAPPAMACSLGRGRPPRC